jgi:hypothetical protein
MYLYLLTEFDTYEPCIVMKTAQGLKLSLEEVLAYAKIMDRMKSQ